MTVTKSAPKFTAYVVLSLISLGTGFFLNAAFFQKKAIKHTPAAQTNNSAPVSWLLNPFLNCIDENDINMSELKLFKPAIEKYIGEVSKKYPDIHISYYFRDLNNGLWLGLNEKDEFSPASLMKVPLMISVLKEAEAKPTILTTKIQYLKSDFSNMDEESGFAKKDKEYYTVEQLLEHVVYYSDNAASVLLMQFIGMDKVAKTEDDLNLHVKPEYGVYSNFVTVKAYAGVFRVLYNASYLNRQMSEKALKLLTGVKYSNGIRAGIPPQYQIAHKYGERDIFDKVGKRNILQLHHFALVYYPAKPFLLGIMTRGATREGKEKIIKDLTQITFSEFEKQLKSHSKEIVLSN